MLLVVRVLFVLSGTTTDSAGVLSVVHRIPWLVTGLTWLMKSRVGRHHEDHGP